MFDESEKFYRRLNGCFGCLIWFFGILFALGLLSFIMSVIGQYF